MAWTSAFGYAGRMHRFLLKAAAWLLFAAIIAVTVSPVGLRPELGLGPEFDRSVGYFVLGAAFALAYPGRRAALLFLLVCGAFAIEALQFLEPDRDPRIMDAMVKAASGVAGIGFLRLLLFVRSARRGPAASVPRRTSPTTVAASAGAMCGKELVGVAGFEPATPSSRTRCATRLRYTPKLPAALAAATASYRLGGADARAIRARKIIRRDRSSEGRVPARGHSRSPRRSRHRRVA